MLDGEAMPSAVVRTAGLVGALVALAAPLPAGAEMKFRYDCRVTGTSLVDGLGREGQTAQLNHFTCRVKGGLLDGFTATGSNILEPRPGGGRLVASIVVAQKGESSLVYEVREGTRRLRMNNGEVVGWDSTGAGTYKSATGAAAPLVGKSFNSIVHSTGPDEFTIDVVVKD